MALTLTAPSAVSLGKRKALDTAPFTRIYTLSARGSSPSNDSDNSFLSDDTQSDNESVDVATSSRPPCRIVKKARVKCGHPGCDKSYSKPSRLAEHERSHSGDRPFSCGTCPKSFLRESHLQAHTRTHLPESARPFACLNTPCTKRFWTQQHLDNHVRAVHEGVKPFPCTSCSESFAKHNQLRSHFALAHCPPGTKPFQCQHLDCTKSFSTMQKLRSHSKTHQENRYTCGDEACLITAPDSTTRKMPSFSTWSDLQAHMRTIHPPRCSYPECKDRVFASKHNLRSHLKVHEDHEAEDQIERALGIENIDVDSVGRETKRRRGGDVGRDWECTNDECTKAFKSKKALTSHINITHLGHRPFSCPEPSCDKAFGYKHVLQRHIAQKHTVHNEVETQVEPEPELEEASPSTLDLLTGAHYAKRGTASGKKRTLSCPWAELLGGSDAKKCGFMFSRAYDLGRHLRGAHGMEVETSVVNEWLGKYLVSG